MIQPRRPSRRKLIGYAAGLTSAGAVSGLFFDHHSLPAPDPAATLRYRQLQDNLLQRHGVPAQSRFLDIPNPKLRVHLLEAGQGDPVVFIHGGNSVAAGWIPLLARFHSRFHLYAPDRPGCGLTSMFLYNGVPLRAHAVAFVESLLDQLQLPRAAIVANSMGGYFSLVFALAYPHRVSKLVLIGEPAGSAPSIPLPNRLMGTRIANSLLYRTVLKPGPAATRKSFASRLVADIDGVPQDFLDCMTAGSLLPGAAQSWITLNEAVYTIPGAGLFLGGANLTHSLRPELPRLSVPTLFLWGEKDAFGPPSIGHEMARLMPNARCETIPGAGHLPWLDQLDLCAGNISAFLA